MSCVATEESGPASPGTPGRARAASPLYRHSSSLRASRTPRPGSIAVPRGRTAQPSVQLRHRGRPS
eukprot:6396038-Lingulodinium_polyedra.AAC.1